MMSEEGMFHGNPEADHTTGEPRIDQPAEWPRAAEHMAKRAGWWPALLAAAGSFVTLVAAVFVVRRRSKRHGVMAAVPSSIAEATEQVSQVADHVMKSREQLMHGSSRNSVRNPLRAILALGAVALAGWGLKRTMAHQA